MWVSSLQVFSFINVSGIYSMCSCSYDYLYILQSLLKLYKVKKLDVKDFVRKAMTNMGKFGVMKVVNMCFLSPTGTLVHPGESFLQYFQGTGVAAMGQGGCYWQLWYWGPALGNFLYADQLSPNITVQKINNRNFVLYLPKNLKTILPKGYMNCQNPIEYITYELFRLELEAGKFAWMWYGKKCGTLLFPEETSKTMMFRLMITEW